MCKGLDRFELCFQFPFKSSAASQVHGHCTPVYCSSKREGRLTDFTQSPLVTALVILEGLSLSMIFWHGGGATRPCGILKTKPASTFCFKLSRLTEYIMSVNDVTMVVTVWLVIKNLRCLFVVIQLVSE
jgi:hypothetical protein